MGAVRHDVRRGRDPAKQCAVNCPMVFSYWYFEGVFSTTPLSRRRPYAVDERGAFDKKRQSWKLLLKTMLCAF